MGKLGYILLGVVLALGAMSFGGYRHFGGQRTHQGAQSRSVSVPQSAPRPGASAPAATPTTQVSATQIFDWSLNGANLFVGLIGIWLAMKGIRKS